MFLVSWVKLVGYSPESLYSMYTQIDIQGGFSNDLNGGFLLQTQKTKTNLPFGVYEKLNSTAN